MKKKIEGLVLRPEVLEKYSKLPTFAAKSTTTLYPLQTVQDALNQCIEMGRFGTAEALEALKGVVCAANTIDV